MNYYAGIDVSLKESSVCVVDAAGKVTREVKVGSEPECLVGYFDQLDLPVERIGLEAGPPVSRDGLRATPSANPETPDSHLDRRATPERALEAIRAHWGIESMRWVLDAIFKEDQSRLRRGYGAQNMALVRRLAFNIVRAGRGRKSIKTARKAAGWNPAFLTSLLQPQRR